MSKEDKLRGAIEDILWMAIRYADGRRTYAPSTVRRAVKVFKEVYPDFKVKHDITIEPPKEEELKVGDKILSNGDVIEITQEMLDYYKRCKTLFGMTNGLAMLTL